MNLYHLTVASLASPTAHVSAEEAAAQLQGRCSARVSYAQKCTPADERAYGHFFMAADTVATALGRQLAPDDFSAPPVPPATALALHRWVRDHERTDENDEPASILPSAWAGLAHVVEELFSENQARVFCTCCNRNVTRREIRLERSARKAEGVHYRYLCAEGHLLLGLNSAQVIVAEARAA